MSKIFIEKYHGWKIHWSDERQRYLAEKIDYHSKRWGIYGLVLGGVFVIHGLISSNVLSFLVGLTGVVIMSGMVRTSKDRLDNVSIDELKRVIRGVKDE